MIRRLAVCVVLLLLPLPGMASDIDLPAGARELTDRVTRLGTYDLPVGPFLNGAIKTRTFEGRVERRSWRFPSADATTLQMLVPLRKQILAAGYDIVLQCEDRSCGGFDFRFRTEVIPPPDMHVDVRDYRFLSAVKGERAALSLLVSRSRNAAYVQLIQVAPSEDGPLVAVPDKPSSRVNPTEPGDDLIARLLADGHVVLADLEFSEGAVSLGAGPFASLEQLAALLSDRPDLRIALVGHTDSIGSLADNVALSKRRAAAVRARLLSRYGVAEGRIDAEGMGYLAPVAPNLTEAGRDANRRVEAILLPAR